MELATSRLVLDSASFCDQEFVVRVELHFFFTRVAATIFEPSNHPRVDRFSTLQRGAVRARADKEANLFLSAKDPIPSASFIMHKFCSRRRKIITFGRQNKPGLRSGMLDEV